jgi:predicted dienelactone hydrolase
MPQATATTQQVAEETAGVEVAQEPIPLPLSESGAYRVGVREFSAVDASRDGREVSIRIWYPAMWPAGETKKRVLPKAEPDRSAAPYPVILSWYGSGSVFGPHLASHGFLVAGVEAKEEFGLRLIDSPLDLLFALDQIATNPPDGFEGVADSMRAGVLGLGGDAIAASTLGGARVDPAFYVAQCEVAPTMEPALADWWIDYTCNMEVTWDEISAHAAEAALTRNDGGLWLPITDERILAVMPMAPESAWFYGERGLAAVDRPTLLIAATEDVINPYDLEACFMLDHMDPAVGSMISFVGEDHFSMAATEPLARMRHFATAFFGYHLQGREGLAHYFSKEFVAQFDELAWGCARGSDGRSGSHLPGRVALLKVQSDRRR